VGTSIVGWVTGPDSPTETIKRFAISGTDLGIMWDNGSNEVLIAFGDTYGYCSVPGQQWRYNTLLRSQDRSLSNTINVTSSPLWRPGLSKQIINTIKAAPEEDGIIPTTGISVGRAQYLNFMSIKQWESSGQWSTNFSAIAVSGDDGQNWGVYPGTIRTPEAGNENFQMGAFLRPGPGDPYLYLFGTPPGRAGSAYVARVPPRVVPDLTKYEYWNSDSGSWVPRNPAAATPVIPGPVGEMSAQYNSYLNKYLALYCNGMNDVVARTAPAPQGPWGPEQLLVPSMQIPGGIYAPFLHPWSTGKELYFNLSLWSAYNVMLMKATLP
jgi:D-arabinan endo alpha-(1,5)-arabinofuranosidase